MSHPSRLQTQRFATILAYPSMLSPLRGFIFLSVILPVSLHEHTMRFDITHSLRDYTLQHSQPWPVPSEAQLFLSPGVCARSEGVWYFIYTIFGLLIE